jgi:hypothetical protein
VTDWNGFGTVGEEQRVASDSGTGDGADGNAPHYGPVFVDGLGANADWSKTRGLDVSLDTAEKCRAWMVSDGITPEHLRRMAIFSDFNRAVYPWLDRLAVQT